MKHREESYPYHEGNQLYPLTTPLFIRCSTLHISRRRPATERGNTMCSNVPHARRRSPAQAHISFAMTIILVVGAAATVVLRPEDNNGMDLDVFGESDEGLQHLSWAAVPLKKTPRRGRNRRYEYVCETIIVHGRGRIAMDHLMPYYLGTERVGFSPTSQTFLPPSRSSVKR